MFKIGDAVCINPKYTFGVDTVRGYISNNRPINDADIHIIDWEDGSKGGVTLNPPDDFLILV